MESSYVLNPRTNRLIKKNTQTYKRLVREGVKTPLFEIVPDKPREESKVYDGILDGALPLSRDEVMEKLRKYAKIESKSVIKRPVKSEKNVSAILAPIIMPYLKVMMVEAIRRDRRRCKKNRI